MVTIFISLAIIAIFGTIYFLLIIPKLRYEYDCYIRLVAEDMERKENKEKYVWYADYTREKINSKEVKKKALKKYIPIHILVIILVLITIIGLILGTYILINTAYEIEYQVYESKVNDIQRAIDHLKEIDTSLNAIDINQYVLQKYNIDIINLNVKLTREKAYMNMWLSCDIKSETRNKFRNLKTVVI